MRVAEFSVCFSEAARQVAACRDEFCKLDTYIGDGDHGITVERGFLAAAEAATMSADSFEQMFTGIGSAMSRTMGGAIGPLYGAFWSGVATNMKGIESLNSMLIAQAITAGVEKVKRLGKTSEGDKTLVDAMAPCARAMMEARSESLAKVFDQGAKAAVLGSQATKLMVARKGRARFLGDKSSGYIDPGASSFAKFMDALAQAINTEEDIRNP